LKCDASGHRTHECHMFRVTNALPQRGQVQSGLSHAGVEERGLVRLMRR
jgi:hypothetical protein